MPFPHENVLLAGILTLIFPDLPAHRAPDADPPPQIPSRPLFLQDVPLPCPADQRRGPWCRICRRDRGPPEGQRAGYVDVQERCAVGEERVRVSTVLMGGLHGSGLGGRSVERRFASPGYYVHLHQDLAS